MRLRSEAEAPFRSLRFVLFGAVIASAGLSLLVSFPQVSLVAPQPHTSGPTLSQPHLGVLRVT